MPESNSKPLPRKKRRWLRRTLWTLLAIFVALVALHRPLIHYGGRWAAIWLAKKQHLQLDLRLAGNVWSTFEIAELHAVADGTGPAPLERLDLDHLGLHYDVWKLIHGDLAGLESLEIGQVTAVITPSAAPEPPKPAKPSRPMGDQLRDFLGKPLPTPTIRLGRLDLTVKQTGKPIEVHGLYCDFVPNQTGHLGWTEIAIPGAPVLPPVEATTALSPQALVLHYAVPTGDLRLVDLRIETTTAAQPGGIRLRLEGLNSLATAELSPTGQPGEIRAGLQVGELDLAAIGQRFGPAWPVAVKLADIHLDVTGVPEKPATLTVQLHTAATVPEGGSFGGSQFEAQLALQQKVLTLQKLHLSSVGVELVGTGQIPLPEELFAGRTDLATIPAGQLQFNLIAKDLARLGAALRADLKGSLQVQTTVLSQGGSLSVKSVLDAAEAQFSAVQIGTVHGQLEAAHPWAKFTDLQSLTATFSLGLQRLSARSAQVKQIKLEADLREQIFRLREFRAEQGTSQLTLEAQTTLDAQGLPTGQPWLHFKIAAPNLADFGLVVHGAGFSGAVQADGRFALGNVSLHPPIDPATLLPKLNGLLQIDATDLKVGSALLGEIHGKTVVQDGFVEIQPFTAQFNPKDALQIQGRAALAAPYDYRGTIHLAVQDLAAFQSVLTVLGQKKPLAGRVQLDWDGTGTLHEHRGSGKLSADGIRFGDLRVGEARLGVDYTPTQVETSDLLVVADPLRAAGRLVWKAQRLDISGLELQLQGHSVLTGTISTPLDPTARQPLAPDQPLQAEILAQELDFSQLFQALGQKAPVQGKISAHLAASGTLAKPLILFDTHGSAVIPSAPDTSASPVRTATRTEGAPLTVGRSKTPALPPVQFEAHARYEADQLKVQGNVQTAGLKPLTFHTEIPLALQPLLSGVKPDLGKIPFTAGVDLPASDLREAAKFAEAIQRIDGTAAIAVKATGTFANPRLDGSLNLDLKALRLAGAAPPIDNLSARVNFAENTVSFEHFAGQAGGGPFTLSGKVSLVKLADPVLDLAFKAQEVLVLRDDYILVRADTDVTLRGPLSAGTVGGTVWVTQSRYTREIDILPLSLPGRPKPVPRAVTQPTVISFPDFPLRNLKFDLAIRTRNKDAFKVRGNLASGEASINLRLAGTGLAPYLEGVVTIDRFKASLPVSTLEVKRGLVTFSQRAPFQPDLDLEAESVIRNYTVIARLSGPSTQPRLDLESEPPLPQQEIVSLLTTGSLSGEIGANNTALATRAGILVLKSWYKKVFKKDFLPERDDRGEGFLDRFNLELGNVDPKTGRQEATAQVRMTDKLYFIGDVDVGGGFSGRLKYLIRFR